MKGVAFDVNNSRACFQNLGRMLRILLVASLLLGSWAITGCGVRNDEGGTTVLGTNASKEVASTPLKSGDIVEILFVQGNRILS